MSSIHDALRFDLHMHSNRSDGKLNPAELLERCIASRLDVVSITDHDLPTSICAGPHTMDGHTTFVLHGAEISGVHDGAEYHLLVYFPGDVPEGFQRFCRNLAVARADRYDAAVQSLSLQGLDMADSEAVRGGKALTRHHLARALVDAGHANSWRDAFARYASYEHGHVRRVEMSFIEAIRVARSYGGLTSWAHPPANALVEYLDVFVAAGLQGLEGIRPQQPSRQARAVRRLANRYGLYLTGGSDWHGWTGDLGLFYCQRGQVRGFLDALCGVA